MSHSERASCFGLRFGSGLMGLELGRVATAGGSVFRSSAKSRSVKAQVSDEDLEDNAPLKSPSKSSGSVLPYVGVASLGAILFGYHLGVVNCALEYLAKDLGILENNILQGPGSGVPLFHGLGFGGFGAPVMRSCREMEIKFIVRTLVKNLKIGAMMRTVLPSLAQTILMNSSHETAKETLQGLNVVVVEAYNMLPNLSLVHTTEVWSPRKKSFVVIL